MSDLRCTMPVKGGVCGQPWDPSTGHWESEARHWCWSCTKGMISGMIETTAGRCLTTRLRDPVTRKPNGKKLRTPFYPYAQPPPEAKIFEFTVYQLVPGSRCTFTPVLVEKPAQTLAEALALLDDTHPGHLVSEHLGGLWRIKSGEAIS